jgi:hypothetical protein
MAVAQVGSTAALASAAVAASTGVVADSTAAVAVATAVVDTGNCLDWFKERLAKLPAVFFCPRLRAAQVLPSLRE